jgi:hypothetical protein
MTGDLFAPSFATIAGLWQSSFVSRLFVSGIMTALLFFNEILPDRIWRIFLYLVVRDRAEPFSYL